MSILRYSTPSIAASALTPLARLSAFRQEVDRLFDLPSAHHTASNTGAWAPALDVYQDKDDLSVRIEVPGLKKEDITLSLHDGLLTISGERRPKKTTDHKVTLRNERFFGRFERTVSLPTQVDGTRVTATYEDGILTVILPKAEAAKPRQIEISVK